MQRKTPQRRCLVACFILGVTEATRQSLLQLQVLMQTLLNGNREGREQETPGRREGSY